MHGWGLSCQACRQDSKSSGLHFDEPIVLFLLFLSLYFSSRIDDLQKINVITGLSFVFDL